VVGSEMVEGAMDMVQDELEKEMKQQNMGITDRYSPGYCDWQVSEQPKLFSLLPEKFCGISLSESCLMYPIKSVSGVIGIGPKAERKGYICSFCNMKNCIYRNQRFAVSC
jgi:cobalamin-dependent methionine synthase I